MSEILDGLEEEEEGARSSCSLPRLSGSNIHIGPKSALALTGNWKLKHRDETKAAAAAQDQ